MLSKVITIASVFIAIAAVSSLAVDNHKGGAKSMNHGGAGHSSANQPLEGGQSQFSALIEIVSILENDEKTDWSSVDIDALRSHLLDMNHLMLNSSATTTASGKDQIQYTVTGNTLSTPSIHRMAAAHSKFIEQSRGWSITSSLTENGAIIQIKADDSTIINRLQALGFYGFMSLDSHHQAHHLQIAMGKSH